MEKTQFKKGRGKGIPLGGNWSLRVNPLEDFHLSKKEVEILKSHIKDNVNIVRGVSHEIDYNYTVKDMLVYNLSNISIISSLPRIEGYEGTLDNVKRYVEALEKLKGKALIPEIKAKISARINGKKLVTGAIIERVGDKRLIDFMNIMMGLQFMEEEEKEKHVRNTLKMLEVLKNTCEELVNTMLEIHKLNYTIKGGWRAKESLIIGEKSIHLLGIEKGGTAFGDIKEITESIEYLLDDKFDERIKESTREFLNIFGKTLKDKYYSMYEKLKIKE